MLKSCTSLKVDIVKQNTPILVKIEIVVTISIIIDHTPMPFALCGIGRFVSFISLYLSTYTSMILFSIARTGAIGKPIAKRITYPNWTIISI